MTKNNLPLADQKLALAEAWLKADHIMVHLDARKDGVIVPPHLAGQPGLTLKVSYLFNGQLFVDGEGITAQLRFGSDYQECFLPWGAIWGVTSSKGELRLWPESVPAELLMGVKVDPATLSAEPTREAAKPATADLTAVEGKQKSSEPKPRPKLTLVK